MSTRKYTYGVAVQLYSGTWHGIAGMLDVPLQWAEGYLHCNSQQPGPTSTLRIIRSDGKVMREQQGKTEVSIGMIAGFPSAKQYRDAAARAIARAEQIEEHERRCAERESRP